MNQMHTFTYSVTTRMYEEVRDYMVALYGEMPSEYDIFKVCHYVDTFMQDGYSFESAIRDYFF